MPSVRQSSPLAGGASRATTGLPSWSSAKSNESGFTAPVKPLPAFEPASPTHDVPVHRARNTAVGPSQATFTVPSVWTLTRGVTPWPGEVPSCCQAPTMSCLTMTLPLGASM